MHPFDQGLALEAQADGSWLGTTSPAWQNMVGPFGELTAGLLTQAIVQHPQCLGAPVLLTINYAAGLEPGPFSVWLRAARTNRSTQHWVLEITQRHADGTAHTVITGTAMTAARRDTWSANDTPMPTVPPPEQLPRGCAPLDLAWLARYDMRAVRGDLPASWHGQDNTAHPEQASLTHLWVRDEPARTLDFASLAAMSDIFYPRVWLRRPKMVAAGTVSLTVYFYADARHMAQAGNGYLLCQARAQAFRNGFFDQTGQLWSQGGELLATTHQLVYYKE
jgi:hypothetical protein